MKIDLENKDKDQGHQQTVHQFKIRGKDVCFAAIKGKHMIAAQSAGGPKAGSVELGYRTLAAAILEYMGAEAMTYGELIDLSVSEVTPLLATIDEAQDV
jgi:hypothetical protein